MDITVSTIGPEKAQELLDTAPDFQRPLKARVVETYSRLMRDGKWLPNTLIQMCGGVLIDGQHRLQAIKESGVALSFIVVSFNDGEDPRVRYGMIDQPSIRTAGDVAKADATRREWKVSPTDQTVLCAAVIIIANRFWKETIRLSNIEKVDLAFAWQDEFLRYKEIVSLQASSVFMSAPNVSLALVTLRHQVSKAIPFWYGVITGESDTMNRPYAHLRRFILMNSKGSSAGGGMQKVRSSAAINCWNHHFRDEMMKQLKLPNLATMKIEGTPY